MRQKTGPNGSADKHIKEIIQLLQHKDGATLAQMSKATGWQGHSVRGFLSGTIKKKRGLTVMTERVDGALRYRLGKGA